MVVLPMNPAIGMLEYLIVDGKAYTYIYDLKEFRCQGSVE